MTTLIAPATRVEIPLELLRDSPFNHRTTAADLQIAARAAWSGVDYEARNLLARLWGAADGHALDKRLDTLGVDDLARFIVECGLVGDCVVYGYRVEEPLNLKLLAKAYGLDYAVIAAQASAPAAATPPPAAQAAKKPKAPKAWGANGKPEDEDDEVNDEAGCAGGGTQAALALGEA